MKRYFLILVIVLTLMPIDFARSCCGWIGQQIGRVTGTLSGGMGIPGEMLTAGSINNMGAQLDRNIDHFDAIMAKNAKAFTDSLGGTVKAVDKMLEARSDQLNALVAKNIDFLNRGMEQNIHQLDQSLQNSVTQLGGVVSFFNTSLWVTIKYTAMIALILLCVIFIYQTIQHVPTYKRLPKTQKKRIVKKISFYLAATLFVGIFLFFFQPISAKMIDKTFQKQQQTRESQVTAAMKTFSYGEALKYAEGLYRASPEGKYAYAVKKIQLLNLFFSKDLKDQEGDWSIYNQYSQLISFSGNEHIQDPEIQIISAIYKKHYSQTKPNLLISAYYCQAYFNTKKNIGKDFKLPFYSMNMDNIALDIINQYRLNPYNAKEAQLLLSKEFPDAKDLDIVGNELLKGKINIDQKMMDYPVLYRKELSYLRLMGDQDHLAKYLTGKDTSRIKSEVEKEWLEYLAKLDSKLLPKYMLNESVVLSDHLAYAILKGPTSATLQPFVDKTDAVQSESSFDKSISDKLLTFHIFKRHLIIKLLKNTKDEMAQSTKLAIELNDSRMLYAAIDELCKLYKEIDLLGHDEGVKAYVALMLKASKLDLYYKNPVSQTREPLAYKIFGRFQQKYNTEIKSKKINTDNIREQIDHQLDLSYYNL